jgi:hypothetical protein
MITFRKLGRLGRFGNQLFQYAGTRLYAESNNFSAAFPQWAGTMLFKKMVSYSPTQKVKSAFLPTRQLDDIHSYNSLQKIKYIMGLSSFLPLTTSLDELYKNPEDNINIYSYLQDPLSLKLLTQHKAKVRTWFQFQSGIQEQLQSVTQQFTPWIGVHIRRGDFVKRGLVVESSLFFELLTKIARGRQLFIASDDPNIHTEFAQYSLVRLQNPIKDFPREFFDFWMLMHADTIVAPGSTFSWWAAYLGNNDYYAPPLSHLWRPGYKPVLEKQQI